MHGTDAQVRALLEKLPGQMSRIGEIADLCGHVDNFPTENAMGIATLSFKQCHRAGRPLVIDLRVQFKEWYGQRHWGGPLWQTHQPKWALASHSPSIVREVSMTADDRLEQFRRALADVWHWWSTLRVCRQPRPGGSAFLCGDAAVQGSKMCVRCLMREAFDTAREQGSAKRRRLE